MAQVCLQDVCYRLYGEAVPTAPDIVGLAHYLQELFTRRLRREQCAYVPHLGLSQFKASYFRPFRGPLSHTLFAWESANGVGERETGTAPRPTCPSSVCLLEQGLQFQRQANSDKRIPSTLR